MRFAVIVAMASPLAASCVPRPAARCVESLCFEAPADAELIHEGTRHTIRSRSSVGWVDVQAVEPMMQPPASPDEAIQNIQRRYALLGHGRVLATGRSRIGDEPVASTDVEVRWRGATYRRLTLVAHRGSEWITADITGPSASVDDARRTWLPLLQSAYWVQR